MNTASERFLKFLHTVEGNQNGCKTAFANKIGCSNTQITAWLKGKAFPSPEFIEPMVAQYNLNPAWLRYGTESMFVSQKQTTLNHIWLITDMLTAQNTTQLAENLVHVVKLLQNPDITQQDYLYTPALRLDFFIRTVIGEYRGARSIFAENIGCGKSQISSWTKGKTMPGIDFEFTMRDRFNLNPAWFTYGSGSMFTTSSHFTESCLKEISELLSVKSIVAFTDNIPKAIDIAEKVRAFQIKEYRAVC